MFAAPNQQDTARSGRSSRAMGVGCKNTRMQRLQAYKYELRPDGQQERQMRRFAGSCRFVFNKALALQKERYEQGDRKLGYAQLCKQLTQWKLDSSTAWLADTPSQALQQTLKDLERAYSNFFAQRADFPRFKKKGCSDSFRYPQGCKLDHADVLHLAPDIIIPDRYRQPAILHPASPSLLPCS